MTTRKAPAKNPASPKADTVRKLTTAEAAAEAGAKVPADHQPAAADGPEYNTVDVEFAGKTWTISGEDVDDFAFLVAYRDQDPVTMLEMALGDKQLPKFLTALTEMDGRAKGTRIVEFINKVLREMGEAKN